MANEETEEYIKCAITQGDRLPNVPELESRPPVLRRALIIAPRYEEFGQTYQPLSGTITDARRMHELLVASRYERSNIRVLCDAFEDFYGCADPTRKNILDSLEWLVSGTRPGDYRFLHFTGHGDRCRSDLSTGKECRVVKTGPQERVPGDYELDNHEVPRTDATRTVSIEELVYYNEVLITRLVERRISNKGERDSADAVIWDSELNSCLSKLPKGSTITCVMDCCASGRILNLDHKFLGDGFRGYKEFVGDIVRGYAQPFTVISSEPLSGPIPPNIPSYMSETVPSRVVESLSSFMSGLADIFPRRVSDTAPTRIMEAAIPERERDMNQIEARVFAWSACHQRHWAFETKDGGHLTHAFTQQYRAYGSCTYSELFEKVSQAVTKHRVGAPVPQFIQLWTSLKGHDEDSLANQLDLDVVI